jgi:hypothetical protein
MLFTPLCFQQSEGPLVENYLQIRTFDLVGKFPPPLKRSARKG